MTSLAQQVVVAITSAKQGLGDLVVAATLRTPGSKTYNAATGSYDFTPSDSAIEGVVDKFDYIEQQSPDFNVGDVKFNVFNIDNNINITTEDKIVLNGDVLNVCKVIKNYVGSFVPVITLQLRK